MSRGKAVVGTVVLMLVALAVVGAALLVRAARDRVDGMPAGPSVLRNPDSIVYTAPSGIFFDTGSAALGPGAVPVLQTIAKDIRTSGATGTIVVEGHTDDVGSDGANLTLSNSRAQVVADWLVTEGGLDAGRIQVVGLGERSPAEPNDSDAHRRANRRVVIAVMRDPGARVRTTTPAATPATTDPATSAPASNG